ncbi:MAG: hypothetical protein NTV28_12400 [Propionibacteriales bacterium]|nr:hypothetical protein [Propionibacteriales bacterium]
MTEESSELALRRLIMDALAHTAAETGTVTREQLSALPVADMKWKLIDYSRGIRNPKEMEATLTVMSSPTGPYADAELDGSLFRYDYRTGGTDGDNRKLRRAYELGSPIILLRKIEPKIYVPIFPVYVAADVIEERYFLLALDESIRFLADPTNPTEAERRYISRVTQQRLHQAEFRGRVLRAYETQCAVCALRHGRLLDAAHIIGDSEDAGDPIVRNGLALCKIHHAAYDSDILGVSPDFEVRINPSVLEEVDGPMLKYGLQHMDGRYIKLPKNDADRPDAERLAVRFERFQAAG